MTEHDEEQLAQDADELMTEVAGVVRDLAVQVEAHDRRLDEQAAALEQVLTTGAPAATDEEPVARPWTRGVRSRSDWEALAGWVDEMCSVHAVTALPACWPAHEGLVCELAALRDAWWAAQHTKPSDDLMSWYSYFWHPFVGRLELRDRCRRGHEADPPATATDLTRLPDLPAGEEPA